VLETISSWKKRVEKGIPVEHQNSAPLLISCKGSEQGRHRDAGLDEEEETGEDDDPDIIAAWWALLLMHVYAIGIGT